MATKVHMEALSPTMEEGQLVSWLKAEGDEVVEGDILAEIETDKATMELVARGAGVLRKQLIAEGGTAPVGNVIGVIASADEDISEIVEAAGGAASAAGEGASGEDPDAGADADPDPDAGADDGDDGGQEESSGDAAAESGAAGKTAADGAGDRKADDGAEADDSPGKEAADEAKGGRKRDAKGGPKADERDADSLDEPRPGGGRMRASPLARRLAEEQGLDLTAIEGSGPGGRIVKRDIERAAEEGTGVGEEPAERAPAARPGETVKVSQMRKAIAKRLVQSIGPIPTFYLTIEADVGRLLDLRKRINGRLEEKGEKVSVNDLILKATAEALRRHPEINASWQEDTIERHGSVDLGVAVAIEDGLITPVVRSADRKGVAEIGREVRELAGRARDRKLKPEEYQGATFSVSNLGMFGIQEFTAIINPPEAGILAVGTVEEKPVVEDGEVVVRPRMRVTMSCDHRVIDGAMGAQFLATLRDFLEDPMMMVM